MDKCFKLVLCWVGLVLVCKILVGLCCKFLIGFVVDGGVGVVSCWVDFAGVFEFVIDIVYVDACNRHTICKNQLMLSSCIRIALFLKLTCACFN